MATMQAPQNTGKPEAPTPPSSTTEAAGERGGWRTTPFIIASMGGLTLAQGGCLGNLIVMLIREFHITSINAAQINNVIAGCSSFFPIIAAILADSFLGCFSVICIFSIVTLMGIILLLTITLTGLKPSDCATSSGSDICSSPTRIQYAVLFVALGLVSIGGGGTRFTQATMGANQLTKFNHQSAYFNCYFFTFYLATVISLTLFVYIEDNLGWALGFGMASAANVIGLVAFLIGKRWYYSCGRPKGSPLTGLLRVVVASFRKRKLNISSETADYYYGGKGETQEAPTNSLRLLNHAAVKVEGDILGDGLTVKNPWKVCSVEQVEDLKSLIKILPLWSSSILLSTPIGIQLSLTVLQALTTDRHLGPHFQLPPGSIIVFSLFASALCLIILDYAVWPLWRKTIGKIPTSLQQVGVGHILNITGMAISAVVESKRRTRSTQMPVMWLVPQMAVVGVGEGFHFPGQVSLYYQQFPASLKTMATAMISMLIGLGFYLSTALIDLTRRLTTWLPDNIDEGRVDNMYWMLVLIGVFNFAYFLACCWFYEYKNVDDTEEDVLTCENIIGL